MFQVFPKRTKQKPAGEECMKALLFKEKETAMGGPALLPTSCLKRGYAVWSPLSPFLSELVSCPGAGKQGQESSWEGWLGAKNGGGPPCTSALDCGQLRTQTRFVHRGATSHLSWTLLAPH